MIEKRRLGKEGPPITTVGFGAWALGGPWKFGWGPQDWTLSHPAVTAAIAGARNPAQVEENFGAMGISLSPGDKTEIEKAFEKEPSP